MPGSTQSAQPRLIVIPRQLEGFFYERLTRQFAGRDDLTVVVDRRVGRAPTPALGRRAPGRSASGAAATAATATSSWSLPDMPFSAS